MRSRKSRSDSKSNNEKSKNETYREDLERNEFTLNERNRKMCKCDKDIFCKGKQSNLKTWEQKPE